MCHCPEADPGRGGGRGQGPGPPAPVKTSHKKDRCHTTPHVLQVIRTPLGQISGSATAVFW